VGAESLWGPKSHNNVTDTFFKTVAYICFRNTSRSNMGAPNFFLPQASTNLVTSLRLCTSRLSSRNSEICLQKYLPISGKLSITNYLKENAVDYRSHLSIENNLNVEKKVYYFENKYNFHSHQKNAWGTRRDKHTKTQMQYFCWHFALEGFYCITRTLKMIRQYLSTSQQET